MRVKSICERKKVRQKRSCSIWLLDVFLKWQLNDRRTSLAQYNQRDLPSRLSQLNARMGAS